MPDRSTDAPRSPLLWSGMAAGLAALVMCLFVAAAFIARRAALTGTETTIGAATPAVAMLTAFFGTYVALASGRLRGGAADCVANPRVGVLYALAWPGLLVGLALAYAAWLGLPLGVRTLAYPTYAVAPVLLLTAVRRRQFSNPTLAWVHAGAVALLLVPAALRLLPPLPAPAIGGPDVVKYFGYAVGAWCFLVVAPVPRMGYAAVLDARAVGVALAGFVAFTVVAIPLGAATGFIAWRPRGDAGLLLLLPTLLAFTTALPEELIFRGVIQRLAEGAEVSRPKLGLAVASTVFGIAHLPDPRYMLLAALGGAAYGLVYRRTGLLLAPVVTHVLVDWTWAVFLRR